MATPSSAPTATPNGHASFSLGSLAVAVAFAVVAAVLLNPLFVTPFEVLLGRALFLSMLLMLAFVGAQRLPERFTPSWIPRWMIPLLAVALTAPLGTLLIYLLAVGGRLNDFFDSAPRIEGFVITTGTAVVLGLLTTLTAQLREREARAKNLELQFELERSRLEKLAVDARLDLLQAQIEPHFLFNTLANVQALVESNSPRASAVLQSLISYLRAAVPRLQEREPTLADELVLVRAYLELMQMRMPDRLNFEIDVAARLQAQRFPAMALLTLVENAVRHGLDPSEQGGTIHIGARATGEETRLWVTDNGVGLSEHAQPGTGLNNLRARLSSFYRPAARLELQQSPEQGLLAEIVIPGPQAARVSP